MLQKRGSSPSVIKITIEIASSTVSFDVHKKRTAGVAGRRRAHTAGTAAIATPVTRSQLQANAIVQEWLNVRPFLRDTPVGVAYEEFRAFKKCRIPVTLVKFGRALDAAGVTKRVLRGRILIRSGFYADVTTE